MDGLAEQRDDVAADVAASSAFLDIAGRGGVRRRWCVGENEGYRFGLVTGQIG